jgi:hypothetical protein
MYGPEELSNCCATDVRVTVRRSRRRSGWGASSWEASSVFSISTSGTGDNQSNYQTSRHQMTTAVLLSSQSHRIMLLLVTYPPEAPRPSPRPCLRMHPPSAYLHRRVCAGSLGQLPRPTSVALCLGIALFDVLGHGSIRRLSERMAGAAINDGSFRYLLRSLGDISMLNDRRKVFLLKLAAPSVLAASPLRRCSFWQARR